MDDNLNLRISCYSKLLIKSAAKHGMTSEITVKISQRLDKLLNIIQK